MNKQIRSKRITLIDINGKNVGVYDTDVALQMAERDGYDLIEMNDHQDPPIVKIGDYSREKYKQQQREKQQRKSARAQQVKEIRLGPKIGEHDLETKCNQALKFLQSGDKVKFNVQLRGRERDHRSIAFDLINKVAKSLAEDSVVSTQASANGSFVSMTLSPLR